MYMEKIIQRLTGQRELSLQTLQDMADGEQENDSDKASSNGSTEGGGGGGVDAETYDLQPVNKNVARASIDCNMTVSVLQPLTPS